ncbi:MAG TPA: ATP synthase F1 subunit delta [Cytophagaceae bacterium]|jgi:F-type H+-transporting ATPase subunit delta
MHESRAASRYAKSLIDFAKEKNILDEVNNDMLLVLQIGKENNEFIRVMNNPIVPNDKKQTILTSLFKGRVNPITLKMFELLAIKNRESQLYDIAIAFTEQYKQLKGIITAEVITTFPLSEDLRNQFIQIVAGQNNAPVHLIEKVDQNLLGGYVLKVGDRQIDQSIRNKIQRLKTQFQDNSFISKY